MKICNAVDSSMRLERIIMRMGIYRHVNQDYIIVSIRLMCSGIIPQPIAVFVK